MDRITITIEPELLAGLDAFLQVKGYAGHSEALRDQLRERLRVESTVQDGDGRCLAALTYVYEHHKRQLSNRSTDLHHDRHDLTIATLHVHLDQDSCLEVAVLRGEVGQVRTLSEGVISQSGVRYGHTHFEHIRTLAWRQKL